MNPTDPSMAGRTRSSRTRVAGVTAGPVRPMTQEERDSLPPPIPKGGEDEKVEVAQDGRLSAFPVLLPKNGVVLTREPMEQA